MRLIVALLLLPLAMALAQVFQNILNHHHHHHQGNVCQCNGPPPDTACVGAEECQVNLVSDCPLDPDFHETTQDYHCVRGSCVELVNEVQQCQDIGEECLQDSDCCDGSYCCDYMVCSSLF